MKIAPTIGVVHLTLKEFSENEFNEKIIQRILAGIRKCTRILDDPEKRKRLEGVTNLVLWKSKQAAVFHCIKATLRKYYQDEIIINDHLIATYFKKIRITPDYISYMFAAGVDIK